MPRYQLADKCLFVDATNFETGLREPKELPCAHILDQREQVADPKKHAKYLELNTAAAYITRFIVMGVEIADIPEILRSEYRPVLKDEVDKIDFATQVDEVLKKIKPYLKPGERDYLREYDTPKIKLEEKYKDGSGNPKKGYQLDFSVNWYPVGCCKVPY